MTGCYELNCPTFSLQAPEVFSATLFYPYCGKLRFLQPSQGKEQLCRVPICKDSPCRRWAVEQKQPETTAGVCGWLWYWLLSFWLDEIGWSWREFLFWQEKSFPEPSTTTSLQKCRISRIISSCILSPIAIAISCMTELLSRAIMPGLRVPRTVCSIVLTTGMIRHHMLLSSVSLCKAIILLQGHCIIKKKLFQ